MPDTNVYEDAVDFLLKYVEKTGHNPEYHQARGFLVRIEEAKRQRDLDEETPEKHAPLPAKHGHDAQELLAARAAQENVTRAIQQAIDNGKATPQQAAEMTEGPVAKKP
jgi:hypothetical protein